MRLGLSERIAIEAGIYRRDSLEKIAKDIGISRRAVSEEIRRNRTLAPAARYNGKDCRFAAECTQQFVSMLLLSVLLFSSGVLLNVPLRRQI